MWCYTFRYWSPKPPDFGAKSGDFAVQIGDPMEDLYYSDYIELEKILNSQHPRSFESLEEGNDEMLFIIIHQVYELWFKQVLFELDLIRHIFIQDRINDNSDDLSKVVQKLK